MNATGGTVDGPGAGRPMGEPFALSYRGAPPDFGAAAARAALTAIGWTPKHYPFAVLETCALQVLLGQAKWQLDLADLLAVDEEREPDDGTPEQHRAAARALVQVFKARTAPEGTTR